MMLVMSIISTLFDLPLWPAAILGWLATCRLGRRLPKASRRQALWLGGIGLLFWATALLRQTPASPLTAVVTNQPLLMMFAGVSFLSLATPVQDPAKGRKPGSLIGTLLGVHLFGAVINISVLYLFGDRMQRNDTLDRRQVIVLGRSYSAGAAWSPFFVAMGVALAYAPGLDFMALLPWGLACAALLLLLTYFDAWRIDGDFIGYPLQAQALVLPSLMAITVVLMHHFWPSLAIPLIISIVSPLFAILLMPHGMKRTRLQNFLNGGLARVVPQFALFLAAGVFSSGLTALLVSWPEGFALPIDKFNQWHAWVTLGIIVFFAFIGIHPLVGVATLAPLLAPLSPDPTLLGMVFLMGWAVGTGSSPLSGSNLALSARYGVKAKDILRWNLPYALLGWLACGLVFAGHAWLEGAT